jgi:hypothetical protein
MICGALGAKLVVPTEPDLHEPPGQGDTHGIGSNSKTSPMDR